MMKDVIENQKQESRGDDCEGTMKSVDETKLTTEDEANRAQEK